MKQSSRPLLFHSLSSLRTGLHAVLRHANKKKRPQDCRGTRIVAVIECILNQNARDAGVAVFPAMNEELVRLCAQHRAGILQIPCPEIAHLGFRRARGAGQSIRDALDTPQGRRCCCTIGNEIAARIEAYAHEGCRIVAVIGGNSASPGCAVHFENAVMLPTSGVLMRQLHAALLQRGIRIPFHGMRDNGIETLKEDLRWLEDVFAKEAM
jgi:predicted secreted protein